MKGSRSVAALLIGATVLAAACSSSDGNKTATTTAAAGAQTTAAAAQTTAAAAPTTAGGTSASDAPASSAGGSNSLESLIDGYLQRPTTIPISVKIDKPIPKGKRIAGFVCPLPACQALAKSASEAAAALGWEYIQIPLGFAPDEVVTAWEQALREKPDGILTLSTEQALYQSQLDKAKAANIPVISMLVAKEAANGIDAVIYGPDFMARIGKEMADWVAVDSKSDPSTKTLLVYPAQITILAQQAQAFADEYAKVCAECKLEKLEVPATSIGGDLNDRITGALRAAPDVNYAWVGYDDMLRGLPAALGAAGISKVKIFSNGGQLSPDTAAYLREDKAIQMIYDYAGLEVMWRGMDYFARHFAGVPTDPSLDTSTEKVWMVTPKTAPDGGAPNLVADYAAQYKALWGVG